MIKVKRRPVWWTLIREAYLEEGNFDRGTQRETHGEGMGRHFSHAKEEAPQKPALPTCLRLSDTRTKRKPSSVFNMLGLYRTPGTQI